MILHIEVPSVKGYQSKIDEYFRNEKLQSSYKEWCRVIVTKADPKVISNIYHSLSTHVHGGGLPIECRLEDRILSPAEWACVITILNNYLEPSDFKVFDMEGNKISK